MDLLHIEDLSVRLGTGADRPFAVQNVDLRVAPGEVLCLVGESGSGKSMTANAILGLTPPGATPCAGRILFEGTDLRAFPRDQLRRVRGAAIGMIFQDPMTALNPLHRVGAQVAEALRQHSDLSRAAIQKRVLALFERMHLPDPASIARAYPHELSGGQRQRAMIAMAVALEPRLLIADEPTTALDVTTQAQILALLAELRQRTGMGMLFITHDFGVVADIAANVAVMRQGRIVEQGSVDQVLSHPADPYTRALIEAVPSLVPTARPPASGATILDVAGLCKTYRKRGRVSVALADISIRLPRGATLGIVGESGSGKSTLARCITRLIPADSGSIRLDDTDVLQMRRGLWRRQARRIQMVFQDPTSSLNPRKRVGDIVMAGPMLHGASRAEALATATDLFTLVGLEPDSLRRFPHEFSGGQRQRIGIARALALKPDLLLADEAVSALDVSVQAQVLALLADLRDRLGLAMIFITHDLRVAAQICDRVAIMRAGRVVEEGPVAEILLHPKDPYSQALRDAVPGRQWQRSHNMVPA
jgi:peptide/nickel transport system ATP-binding protein